jgi:general L-amino acid transport system substrate-binding protein
MTSPRRIAAISFRQILLRLLLPAGLLFSLMCGSAHAAAGETLAQVKARGTLRCGVSEGIPGFSIQDAKGNWSGLDVDFCRAVAAAVLGDGNKVTFVPLRASARFPALRAGQIDLLSRNTTWTLLREAGLKIQFAGVLYYDGQGFMVLAKSKIRKVAELKGATVCVEKGTTSAQHLADYSAALSLGLKPLVIDSAIEITDAFMAGKCRAFTSDASQLAAARLRVPGGLQSMVILPERISKEPLAPAVRAGDDDWLTIVRWVLFGLIDLEDAGITRENIGKRMEDPRIKNAMAAGEEISKMLGVPPGWGLRALKTVGNYGEMYERNVGSASALKLERGLNRLWKQGGLMYAPPLQ